MSLDPWRMLGGNLRVALNLEQRKRNQRIHDQWLALEARCNAMACTLVSSEDGPLLYDRDGDVIDVAGICDEESQELPMTLHFVEKLERNGGRR